MSDLAIKRNSRLQSCQGEGGRGGGLPLGCVIRGKDRMRVVLCVECGANLVQPVSLPQSAPLWLFPEQSGRRRSEEPRRIRGPYTVQRSTQQYHPEGRKTGKAQIKRAWERNREATDHVARRAQGRRGGNGLRLEHALQARALAPLGRQARLGRRERQGQGERAKAKKRGRKDAVIRQMRTHTN